MTFELCYGHKVNEIFHILAPIGPSNIDLKKKKIDHVLGGKNTLTNVTVEEEKKRKVIFP